MRAEQVWDVFARQLFGDDTFISYSRENSAYVLSLANELVAKGLSPYVDQWASPLGAELPSSLRRALRRSSMLVVVATPESARSENVAREIQHFVPTQRAVCVALRAFEVADTAEGESALRSALMLPRPTRILPVNCRSAQFGRNALLTLDADHRASLWAPSTGALIKTLPGDVETAEWSADGTAVMTTSANSQVQVWDGGTGQPMSRFDYPGSVVLHASFGPDDRWILTAHEDGSIRVRPYSGGPAENILTSSTPAVRVWYDDDYLVVWTHNPEGGYQHGVWTVGPGAKLTSLGPFPAFFFAPPIRPQGRWLIFPDEFEDLSAPQDGHERAVLELAGKHMALTRDGTFGLTGLGPVASVWQLWTKHPAMVLSAHESSVVAANFSPDGRALVTITERGVARVWAFPQKILFAGPERPLMTEVTSLGFSPDGTTLASADRWGAFQAWDVSSGGAHDVPEGPKKLQEERGQADFDATGTLLLTSSQLGKIGRWDARSREPIDDRVLPPGDVPRFSRDGRFVATAMSDGGVAFFDLRTGENWEVDKGSKYVALAVTPDGGHVVAADARGNVSVHGSRRWELAAELRGGCRDVQEIELDEDGWLAVIRGKKDALVWRWRTGSAASRLDTGNRDVRAVAVSGAASMVLVATGSTVRAYDLETTTLLQELDDLGREATALAYLPSGHVIASAENGMNIGAFIHVQSCEACVPRRELAGTARAAIRALASEEARIAP